MPKLSPVAGWTADDWFPFLACFSVFCISFFFIHFKKYLSSIQLPKSDRWKG